MSEQIDKAEMPPMSPWQAFAVDLAHCLRFYSRLPVPALPYEQNAHALPDFPRLIRVLPVAGLILGLLPALTFALALLFNLGPFLAATLTVAVMVVITGAFHEDGLADTADSFGGVTQERRLEIMRDSRIGSFGAAALFLGLALRIGALAVVAGRSDGLVGVAVILATASLSRAAGLMPLTFLPPARADGAAHAVGQPSRESFWFAAGLSGIIALALGLLAGIPFAGLVLMLALSALAGWGMMRLSLRHLGGQTGDIAGATQQVAEIAALIGLLTVMQP
jgi:adenosylcobinamide-GDP ribazoletransferase